MSRPTVAKVLAVGLLLALVFAAALLPVPYVLVAPGRTIDVLGKEGGKPIVRVDGHRTYPTEGDLRLTTVAISKPDTKVTLLEALPAWMWPDVAVFPYAGVYSEEATNEQERAESSAQMVSAQDTAVAAALTELGYELPTHAEVTGVSPGGPSEGKLEPRDRIETIAGRRIADVEDVLAEVGKADPGDTLEIEVRRDGRLRTVNVSTIAAKDDPKHALIGVLVATGYDFPFDVRVAIDEEVGGPSAGLMIALSIYDTLTPGALTDGENVAGTGTVSADGEVGRIGHIRQKIAGAEESGAALFLVPPGNCESAVAVPVEEIRLVRADTMASAVRALEKYAQDPDADLPRCPS